MEKPQNGIIVTADDLNAIPNPTSYFRSWVWDAFFQGRIDTLVKACILAGFATTVQEALEYLQRIASTMTQHPRHITVADLQRSSSGSRYSELEQLITGQEPRRCQPHLGHGQISHQVVYDIMVGTLFSSDHQPHPPTPDHQAQCLLFPETPKSDAIIAPGQLEFFKAESMTHASGPNTQTPHDKDRARQLTRRLCTQWLQARQVYSHGRLTDWHQSPRKVRHLVSTASLLFPEAISRLRKLGDDLDETLLVLSVMSWAAALSHYRSPQYRQTYFREIAVLDAKHGLSGGRVDALEVRLIDGKPPTRSAQNVIQSIASQATSTGFAIRQLIQYFRKPLELVVLDWKFLIGDVIQSFTDDRIPAVQEPLEDHVRQMQRYLTLIPLAVNLHSGNGASPWQTDQYTLSGELVYVLPDRLPVVFPMQFNPEERAARFTDEIARNWTLASHRAYHRQLSNRLTEHLVHNLAHTESTKRRRQTVQSAQSGTTLFPDWPRTASAQDIVSTHQFPGENFVDAASIIEIIGTYRGKPLYGMHFDTLVDAMEKGQVYSGRFDELRGGKIACLMPDHQDPNPSMHVYLDDFPPRFHCFGCGTTGIILTESIPPDALARIQAVPRDQRRIAVLSSRGTLLALPFVPDEHHAIMSVAQGLLAQAFKSSTMVQHYLRVQRRIDPDLAFAYGGGCGTESLIHGLLDSGHTLDELIHYGFVGLSAAMEPRRTLEHLLQQRGYQRHEIERPVKVKKEKTEIPGRPYNVLANRFTVPLTIEQRITNFYGRAAFPCHRNFAHLKLSSKQTRVKQGGFNMAALTGDGPEIIVTEAMIDALTLVQMGHPQTVAIIGTGNHVIIQEVARTAKDVAIALNNDASGLRESQRLLKELQTYGHPGERRDFMQHFSTHHTEVDYKDFNEWWTKYGHQEPVTSAARV